MAPVQSRQQAALLFNSYSPTSITEVIHESVQSSACNDVRLVETQEVDAALLVLHTLTILPTAVTPNFPAYFTAFIAENLMMQLRLIVAVQLQTCPLAIRLA